MTEFIVPEVHVEGHAVEMIVEGIIKDWKRVRPAEYRVWPKVCAERRKSMNREGWTQEGHMKLQVVYPSYVLFMLQRKIGKNDLTEREHRALLRVLPCCRMDPNVGTRSSVLAEGDRNK